MSATPIVLQAEESECGAACLGIVLGHFGRPVPAHEVRSVCGVGRDGLTAAALVRAAAHYGLRCVGKRVGRPDTGATALMHSLRTIPTPAILLLRETHYVVLEGVTGRNQVVLNDPATGRRHLNATEFAEQFSQLALVISPTDEFVPTDSAPDPPVTGIRCLAPYRLRVMLAILCGLLTGLCWAGAALLLRHGFSVALIVLAVGAGVAAFAQRAITANVAAELAYERSRKFVEHLLRLPGTFFRRRFTAGVAARASLVETTFVLLTHRVILALAGIAALIPVMTTLAVLAVPVAGAALGGMLLSAILRWVASRRSAAVRYQLAITQNRRNAVAEHGLAAVAQMHGVLAEVDLLDELADITTADIRLRDEADAASARWLAAAIGAEFAGVMAAVVLTAAGRGLAVTGIMLLLGLALPMGRVAADAITDLPRFLARMVWLDDVMTEPADSRCAETACYQSDVGRLAGRIELDGIADGGLPALTLAIRPGQWAVVTGPLGSGKSRLLQMLAGSRMPAVGEIRFDGRPAATIPRTLLVPSIGYVSADPWLFAGSVTDNITLAERGITDDMVNAALRDSGLDTALSARGQDRWAMVEPDGCNFSTGERLCIALARTLARDPAILLLDDTLNRLDPALVGRLEAAIRRRAITVVVASDRPDIVATPDRVLTLGGRP